MLAAGCVCPHPPLLVPGVATGVTEVTEPLRRSAGAAVRAVVASGIDLLVVVGAAPRFGPFEQGASGSLAPYGVDVVVGPAERPSELPLSLTVGLWLADEHASTTPRVLFGVPADASPDRCAELGATLAARAPRTGLLVMGDGSARRSPKGPGYLDGRAAPFDSSCAAALAAADADAVLALDPVLADDLLVAGRPSWQVLAGAAREAPTGWTGELTYAAAPYGVTYLVVTWLPVPTPGKADGPGPSGQA